MPLLIVPLLLLLCLAGCSSNDSKPDDQLKPASLKSFKEKSELSYLFGDNIGELDRYYNRFQLALDEKALYGASKEGHIVKWDKTTGKRLLDKPLKEVLTSAVAVDDSHLYIGNLKGELVALNKDTGEQVWAQQLSSEVISSPVIEGNHLVVQTNDGAVYNLSPDTGEKRWRHDSNMPSLTLRGTSQAAIFSPYTAIGFANGTLGIFDLATGQLRWQDRVAVPKGDTEIERLVDVDAAPLIVNDKMFAVSYQGKVAAFHLQSGQKQWEKDASGYVNLTASEGRLYVSDASGKLVALDQQSGTQIWQQNALLRRKPTSMTVANNLLAVTDSFGVLHVLNSSTGEVVGRRSLTLPKRPVPGHDKTIQTQRLMKPFPGIRVASLSDEDRLYLLANNGQLFAFSIKEK